MMQIARSGFCKLFFISKKISHAIEKIFLFKLAEFYVVKNIYRSIIG